MALTDSSFNAKGDTITAFETIDDASRDFGVKVHSNHICGVYGESMETPLAVGVRENQIVEKTGVFGRGDNIGVEGSADLVGVYGTGTLTQGDLAPLTQSGIGVVGYSSNNRAAVFQCSARPGFADNEDFLETVNSPEKEAETSAQMRLVPRPRIKDTKNNVEQQLPENGLAGDFFVVYGGANHEAIVWFCVRSHNDKGDKGEWGMIQLTNMRDGGDRALLP